MFKKIMLLASVLLLIGTCSFFAYDREQEPETLASGSLSGEVRQAQKLYKNLGQTLDFSKVQLCFKGELLACDEESLTFYLPVDMDSDGWENGSFTSMDDEISILPLEDYTTYEKSEIVASGQPVPFLAFSESEDSYITVQVVFTGLSVVRIETDADLDVDTVFAGSIVFYESCGQTDWTYSSVFEAHERGQTSRAYPKKGYRVNLVAVTPGGISNKNKMSVLGMRSSDSWIFYAIYSDGTKVRDKFNIELWNSFGAEDTSYDAHFGTHMEYVELVVNGEYRGLYGVMEPVDSTQLQISDQEYLYKRTFSRALSTELLDSYTTEEYLTVLGTELKGSDDAGTDYDWQCFRSYVELEEETDDEAFVSSAEELLDMDNMADVWLFIQMIYGEDNIYKNMFYAFKKEADGYRMYQVPWDLDLTWGNVYTDDAEQLYVTSAPELATEKLSWPFADRLIELDAGGIQEKISEKWKELRESVLSDENMEELLEACIHEVQDSGAFARDAARWPDSAHDGDYDALREFMEERLAFLDEELLQKNMHGWIQE